MREKRPPTRGSTWIARASGLLALAGCGLFGGPIPDEGRPVREVYELKDAPPASPALRVSPDPWPGSAPRSRPVIYPPRIFAVHVKEHVDPARDLKIGAHWIYFKLRDSSWVEESLDREPPSSLPLGAPEDFRFVRQALSGRGPAEAFIPFRPIGSPDSLEKEDPSRVRRDEPPAPRPAERRR
jgi:hypothetical protein